jgi:hypothetical protein
MSSSSPRNANSRSKSLAEGRKRTQEVETGEEGAPDSGHAITAPEGATAADLATSALDAAAGAPAQLDDVRPDEGPTGVEAAAPEPTGEESSPLGREILGAAEDMAGEWAPAPPAGSEPSTPLEMLDETDLVDGQARGEASGLIVAGAPPPALRDEEFLRRVVLPPLPPPQTQNGVAFGGAYGDEDLSDKTVISDPPSPELVASWGRPASATARAFKRRMKTPVELTTIELVGLLTGSALAGGLIGALFMSVPQADAPRVSALPAAITAPVRPASAAVPVVAPPPAPRPTVESLPPAQEPPPAPRPTVESLPSPQGPSAPRPTVESLPSPQGPSAEVTEQPSSPRTRKARRSATSRKPAKKEWVDPFEQ